MYEKIILLSIQILLITVMVLMIGLIARAYLKQKKPIFQRFGLVC